MKRSLGILLAVLSVIAADSGVLRAYVGQEWIRQFGTAAEDMGLGAAADGSGNAYVAGYAGGQLDSDPYGGETDVFLAKYGLSGTKEWIRQFGTPGMDQGAAVACYGAGWVYIVGVTSGSLDSQPWAGGEDIFLAKYSPSGEKQWVRQWGTAGYDAAAAVAVDGSGNIYVGGTTAGQLGAEPYAGALDIFLTKYSPSGEQLWTRQDGTADNEETGSISADAEGSVYMTGYTGGGLDGNPDDGGIYAFLIKYDATGQRKWTRQSGTADGFNMGGGVAVDAAGANAFVTGFTTENLDGQASTGSYETFLMKYGSGGDKLWTRLYGTGTDKVDVGSSVSLDEYGYIYITGWSSPTGDEDMFASRYDPDGERERTITVATPDTEWGLGCASGNFEFVFVAGATDGQLPGNTNAGYHDAFLIKKDLVPPRRVTDLSAAPLGGARIRLDWVKSVSSDTAVYNIYYSSDGYAIDYSLVRATAAHPSQTWTSPVLEAGITYNFTVRAEDDLGNEEKNRIAVSTVAVDAPVAVIKLPQAGKKISGNSVLVMAEIIYGGISEVNYVRFEYRPSGASSWQAMEAANTNHPNPDHSSPYFIQWDVSAFAEGGYDLRAVAVDILGNPDPAPRFITVFVDHGKPDIFMQNTGTVLETSVAIDTTLDNVIESDGFGSDSLTVLTIPGGVIDSTGTTVEILAPLSLGGTMAGLKASSVMPVIPGSASRGIAPTGDYRDIRFSTGERQLLKEITVAMSYRDANGDGLIDGTNFPEKYLRVFYYDEAAGAWEKDEETAVDGEANTVTFKTAHLSLFGLFAEPPGTVTDIRAYPNPFKPSLGHAWIKFDNLPYGSTLRVCEISGETVLEQEGIITGEYTWSPVANADSNELGSGVYLYVVTDPSGSKKTGKLAIIR
jgi:hypothetical protein